MSLHKCRVIVTRPEPFGQRLCALLTQAGAVATAIPTIEIVPVQAALPQAAPSDVIFTSQPAVVNAPDYAWQTARLMAIGPSTEKMLNDRFALKVKVTQPAGGGSDSLLTHSALSNVQGRCFWIVTGKHSRPVLADTLRARGASVHLVEVYERRCPTSLSAQQREAFLAADVVVVNSVDAFRHLTHLIGPTGMPSLSQKIICAPGRRVVDFLKSVGFVGQVVQASAPQNEIVLETLKTIAIRLNSGH